MVTPKFGRLICSGGHETYSPLLRVARAQLGHRPKKTRLPTEKELYELPLHTKKDVPVFDAEGVRATLPTEERRLLEEIEHRIFYPAWLRRPESLPDNLPPTNLRPSHVDQLLRAGVAELAGEDENVLAEARANVGFTVVEEKPSGSRLRFILWAKASADDDREFNKELKDGGRGVNLPLLAKLSTIDRDEMSVTFDFTCAFFQRELPKAARRGFRFRAPNPESPGEVVVLQLRRLPMGAVLSPICMQMYACALAAGGVHSVYKMLRREPTWTAEVEADSEGVQRLVYIDNLRVKGPHQETRREMERIIFFAKRFKMTVIVESVVTSPRCCPQKFLGGMWDGAGGVQVADKVAKKLLKFQDLLVHEASIRLTELEQLAGAAVWASGLLRQPLASFWRPITAWRWAIAALNRGVSLSARVAFTKEVRRESVQLIQVLLSRHQRPGGHEDTETERVVVYTDASMSGWGVVLCAKGRTFSVGASWADRDSFPGGAPGGPFFRNLREEHINVLEALAAVAGARLLVKMCTVTPALTMVDFLSDSSVAVAVLRKRMSKSQKLAFACSLFLQCLEPRWNKRWTVTHIPGATNPADLPSREHGDLGPGALGREE